ncbi:N,N-dimethylformamidase beta subunit family domain-containing protein [Gaiella sp.]|uniref:N,N-dimethylformamidase beta subunit family domain-containing protein n=1 Tax=Gaiella sp. TaxID=2663207 RepID=UPI0032638B48
MAIQLSRARLLKRGAAALLILGLAPGTAVAAARRAPAALSASARNAGRRYAGDRALFATVSPGIPGRDVAAIGFRLPRPASIRVEAVQTALRTGRVVWETNARLGRGDHVVNWAPDLGTAVGSYVMRLTVADRAGRRTVLGARRPSSVGQQKAPVVRVLGIEAAFLRRSYLPGEPMELRITADAPALSLQFLRCGAETVSTERHDELAGAPKGEPVPIDWTGKRSGPVTITVQCGGWPPGVYAAQLTAADGRTGFAPFVLRAAETELRRQLVVMPTNTWQAYNFYDRDGDGWGDTWYAGGSPPVDLARPYRDRGVPPRFKTYDRAFLRWLARTGRTPDFAADDDLETFATGDDLRARYDLVVFPGHSEYMTTHAYDVIERYRDLGGRLVFLSANNFFWKVESDGSTLRRVKLWREVGRPEARLLGVQYRANDDGRRQGSYTVVAAEAAPWLFDKTGLVTGSTFGEAVGGYGIEIDMATPDSPPGTIVLARVVDLFGPGLSGEMTYYETEAGARVFSAGTLDFGGSSTFWPTSRLLTNLWNHMLADVIPPPTEPAAPPSGG